jgi:hypothetical protein
LDDRGKTAGIFSGYNDNRFRERLERENGCGE